MRLSSVVLAVFLVSAAFFGGRAWTALHTTTTTTHSKSIERIKVGDRVYVSPANSENDLSLGLEVNPASWRRIKLAMPKPRGGQIDIELLRPASWISENEIEVGKRIFLSLPEIGPEGWANVLAVAPCPSVGQGAGRTVTGTFSHAADNVIDLYVDGLNAPIGITTTHFVYSVDRKRFVPAGELRVGECLQHNSGEAQIQRIEPRPGTHSVYNIEVHVAHVYHVTQAGVLVHNNCPTPGKAGPPVKQDNNGRWHDAQGRFAKAPQADLGQPGLKRNPDGSVKNPLDQVDQIRKARRAGQLIESEGKSNQNLDNYLRDLARGGPEVE